LRIYLRQRRRIGDQPPNTEPSKGTTTAEEERITALLKGREVKTSTSTSDGETSTTPLATSPGKKIE
jgi:hypothetical protein